MEMRKKGLSIKFKLLFALIALPFLSLLLYLILAVRLFQDDKIAYVFDSGAVISGSLATQADSTLQAGLEFLKGEAAGFRGQKFDPAAREAFLQHNNVKSVTVYALADSAQKGKLGELTRGQGTPLTPPDIRTACRDDLWVRTVAEKVDIESTKILLGACLRAATEQTRYFFVAEILAPGLFRGFRKEGGYSNYLADSRGVQVLGPSGVSPLDFSGWDFFPRIRQKDLPSGVAESGAPDGRTLLVSFSRLSSGGLFAVSMVEKTVALRATAILLAKSVLFFIAILAAAVIISIFASQRLTAALRGLVGAADRVAAGDFSVRVQVKSGDEVGRLAGSFNHMAEEVARLMEEQVAKTRMEKELETARHVQETLFPTPHFRSGPLELSGFYEPASECGGDWWHYCRVGERVLIWIGDVTGHGAPAALMTSAAKSAASIIERLPLVGPGEALQMLNRAIFETSKGKMQMTFFLCSLDISSGELIYANASHNPPYLLRKTGGVATKQDLVSLDEINNPRLGESPDSVYQESRLRVALGDWLLLYTDGVTDVVDPNGRSWGERGFLKTFLQRLPHASGANAVAEDLKAAITDFRQGTALLDDVTVVVCKYDQGARA